MKYRVNYGDGHVSPLVHDSKRAAMKERAALEDPGGSFIENDHTAGKPGEWFPCGPPEPARDTIPCPPWFEVVEPETCRLEEL